MYGCGDVRCGGDSRLSSSRQQTDEAYGPFKDDGHWVSGRHKHENRMDCHSSTTTEG